MDIRANDPENWGLLKSRIKELKIFNPENYTDTFLGRRVECRLRATNLGTLASYAKLLSESEKERDSLNRELTINVTSFFRDIKAYEAIKDEVIPFIINAKMNDGESDNSKAINVWSAGASSGEEAYSVAILFKEVLGLKLSKFALNIMGTDIDPDAVEQAKKGIYAAAQLKEAPPEYVKRYFDHLKDGTYAVKDEIKRMVKFQVGDIHSPLKPKNLNLIMCRNTVIYFNAEAKAKLYNDFYNILNKNGFLVLGKTEIILGPARELFQTFNSNERVYCKE